MEDFIKRNIHLVERIRKYESEKRFAHSLRMTELALSYAECYGIDRELTWKTGMLHDIAKGMSTDEMVASAEKYGHTVSQFCLNNPGFMHAEVGALIAEHEFGLKDRDALNAIKYHPTGRPDMSMLEKIIFFSDWAEPGRPNQEALAPLRKMARTDIDEAILKLLPILTNFMLSHHFSEELCLICNIGYDFILNERLEEMASAPKEDDSAEILSDEDFEKAFELALRNNVAIKSVPNIRSLDGFSTTDGRRVKNGMFLRSGSLSRLTPDDADYLQSVVRLSLVIDLRTTMEVKKDPDVIIPGVRYVNVPLAEVIDTIVKDLLEILYAKGETARERAFYTAEFANIGIVSEIYHKLTESPHFEASLKHIIQLLLESEGPVLFHCTSGKDRTGILAALILYILGCSKEDIICDYNASAVSFRTMIEQLKRELQKFGYSREIQNKLHKILSVAPEEISSFLDDIESHYGSSSERIMKAIGFGEKELKTLRDKYLDSNIGDVWGRNDM